MTKHSQPPTMARSFQMTRIVILAMMLLGSSLLTSPAVAVQEDGAGQFDARVRQNADVRTAPSARGKAEAEALRRRMPDLRIEYNPTTGVVSSVYNMSGSLTDPGQGGDPLAIALEWVRLHRALLDLTEEDLAGFEVTDNVFSAVSGTQHIYLRQSHQGLSLYNGQLQVNLDRQRRVISVSNAFLPDLAAAINTEKPELRPAQAVLSAVQMLGVRLAAPPRELGPPSGVDQRTQLQSRGISSQPIEARLMLLPIRRGMARLVWNFQIHTLDSMHVYDMTVDAVSGEVWTRFDWVASDSYKVYPRPVESPNHTMPLPPMDGRAVPTNPADLTSSPFGWHDITGTSGAEFTRMQGNNTHAYDDIDGNNLPPTVEPNCGTSLNCVFPINLAGAPSTYTPAAVANLFYWNNVVHDIQLHYGFDSVAGNFQANTYGQGGSGNDEVQAEAQDGSGTNNANFYTPPDGQRPRMQMYLWNTANPSIDGDLDSGVIVHEYGHGISNRLVGGPSNVSCLTNVQQPGEGLSDWWSLVYTHKPGDQSTDPRGIGTYVLNQPTSGLGVRPQRYSTDSSVNTWTYESIRTAVIPHGVGAVWTQAAWEAYWALVATWGFDLDLYNATGPAGNQRMMLYVNEGLKLTPCNPTFTQVRDGILQAASLHHGGEDVCTLWVAFAKFGLGSDAISGGPDSNNVTNGFSVPGSCRLDIWTRDNAGDTGTEPYNLGVIWNSPDVRLCTTSPGCNSDEDPVFGTTAYIDVTLNNGTPAQATTGKLFVYYTAFGGAALWNPVPSGNVYGDWTLINAGGTTVTLPAGPASFKVEILWNTVPSPGHYCLLTRWVSAQDPMAFPEIPPTTTNVSNNNNISWKNFNVVSHLHKTSETSEFVVRNVERQRRDVDLKLRADGNFVADGAVLTLRLGDLFARWREAGAKGRNVVVQDPDLVRLTGTPATVLNIPMDAGEAATIEITTTANAPVRHRGTSHAYQVELTQSTGGVVLGGATYTLVTRARDTDTDRDGVKDVKDRDDDGDGVADAQDADPVDPTVGRQGRAECTIDLAHNWHTCGGIPGFEFVKPLAESKAVVKLTLDPAIGGFYRAIFTVDFGDTPRGWVINIGDSRPDRGDGGDAGIQSYSAEVQVLEDDLSIFGNDLLHSNPLRLALAENVAGADKAIQVEVADSFVGWKSPGVSGQLKSPYLFRLSGQRDTEGPASRDIYAAFNRAINGRNRTGTGVRRVRIELIPLSPNASVDVANGTPGVSANR